MARTTRRTLLTAAPALAAAAPASAAISPVAAAAQRVLPCDSLPYGRPAERRWWGKQNAALRGVAAAQSQSVGDLEIKLRLAAEALRIRVSPFEPLEPEDELVLACLRDAQAMLAG